MSAVSKADVLETYSELYDVFEDNKAICKELDKIYDKLNALTSAQPELYYDEWCDDCKEYDKERHCCPRWNRVIRQALKDAQPERKKGKWIDEGWNGDWQYQMDGRGRSWHEWQCSECNHITKGAKWHFCPNCGADMRKEEMSE